MRVVLRRGMKEPAVVTDVDQVVVLSDTGKPILLGYTVVDNNNIVASHVGDDDFVSHLSQVGFTLNYEPDIRKV